jgi:general transcription factor 3C polypeptide 3 (transcription factor C subunit 4)
VIKISEENPGIKGDMRWEAAYNLQMIYMTSGNPMLAKMITGKYLTL